VGERSGVGSRFEVAILEALDGLSTPWPCKSAIGTGCVEDSSRADLDMLRVRVICACRKMPVPLVHGMELR